MTQKPSLDEIFSRYDKRIFRRETPQPKEPPGILDDLWEGAKDYVEGAKLGLAEIGRARDAVMGNIRPIANPLLEPEPGSPNFAYYYQSQYQHVTKDAPVMNDEEQRIWNWYVGAGDSFRDNTLAPAAATVATVAAIPAVLAGAGVIGAGAATAATVGSLAYTPFMVNDLAGSIYKKGYVDTGKEVGMSMIPGVANYMQESDPKFQKFAEAHPGQALWHRTTTALDSFAPLAHPTGKIGRKIYDKAKDPLSIDIIKSQAVDFMQSIKERRFLEKVKDLQKRVKEGKVRPQPPSKEERVAHNIYQAEELDKITPNNAQYSVEGKASIPVKESTLTSPVRVVDIMNTLSELATVRVGHMITGSNVLGYFEKTSKGIRVQNRLDFETMGHELGHKIDDKFGIEGFDEELIDLYHASFLDDTYPPDKHRTEGIAEFTRTYLLNPDEAQRVCPGYYDAFNEVLNKNPELKEKIELLSDQIRQWYSQEPGARVRGTMKMVGEKGWESKEGLFSRLKREAKEKGLDSFAYLREYVKAIEERIGHELTFSENPVNKAKALLSYVNGKTNIILRKNWSPEYQKVLDEVFGKGVFTQKVFWADVWKDADWTGFQKKYKDWLKANNLKNLREAFTTYMTAKHFLEISEEMTRRERKALADNIEELEAIVESEIADYEQKVNKKKEGFIDQITSLEKKVLAVEKRIRKKDADWSNKDLSKRLENARDKLTTYLKSLEGKPPLKKHEKEIRKLQREIDMVVKDIENDKEVKRTDLERERDGYKQEQKRLQGEIEKLEKQQMKPTRTMKQLDRVRRKYEETLAPGYRTPYKTPLMGEEGFNDYATFIENAPKELSDLAMKYRAFNENVLNLMEYYGFIDSGLKEVLLNSYSDYVPLKRMFDVDEHGVENLEQLKQEKTSGGVLLRLSEQGSDRLIIDPLHEYEQMIHHIISVGEKNKLNKHIVDLARKTPDMSEFFLVAPPNDKVNPQERIFAVWNKGKKEMWQAIDPHLYDILKAEDPRNVSKTMKMLALSSKVFREGITTAPNFMFKQFLMDSLHAFISSKSKKIIPFIPIIDSVQGAFRRAASREKDKQLIAEFEVMGIPYSTFIKDGQVYHDFTADASGRKTFDIEDGLRKWTIRQTKRLWGKTIKWNQLMEEAPRIQEFERMRKEGMSLDEAAQAAREITVDFTQAGTTVRRINRYLPFTNATIQGHRTVFNRLTNKETRARSVARLGTLTVASCVLWYINRTEEWYQDIDTDLKNRFWLFDIGNGMIFRIQKPEDYGIFISSVERILDYLVDEDPDALASLVPYLKGVLKPTLLPPMLNTIYECHHNWDEFKSRTIVPPHLQKLSPKNQYDTKTSSIAKSIGSVFGFSPMKIDHFIKGTFGSTGKFIIQSSEEFYSAANELITGQNDGKPEKDLSEKTLSFGFIVNLYRNSEDVRKFYELVDEAEREYADEKELKGKKAAKKPKHWGHMEDTKKKIQKLYGEIRDIEKPETKLSPAQKKAKKNKLEKDIVKEAKKAVAKYRQTK